MELRNQLATVGAPLSDKGQVTELFRSLPSSFSPFAMVANLLNKTLNEPVSSVQSEISRRSNPYNSHSTAAGKPENPSAPPTAKLVFNSAEEGGNRGRGRRGQGRGGRQGDARGVVK